MSKYTCEHCGQMYNIAPIRKCITCGEQMADRSPAAGPWNYDMSEVPNDTPVIYLCKCDFGTGLRYWVSTGAVQFAHAWATINIPEVQ